ncbi:MAG: HAMP domain-containing protein [Desulfobacula sp.]|jgi:signal transduction histidine kinase|nr:HAMP domain-containing protein [Desulfobacula sp.]MBT6339674.1 HAMP domain-containing protein [Desulfobacula sp.]
MKLSGKIFIYSMGLSIIVIIVITNITIIYTRRIMTANIGREQIAASANLMGEIDRTLFQAHQQILLLSREKVMKEVLEHSLQAKSKIEVDLYHVLNEKFFLTGPWNSLSLISRKGIILESVGRESAGQDIGHDKACSLIFQKAIKSQTMKVSFSDLVFSDYMEEPTIVFAAPVFDDFNQKTLGVIMGHFAWDAVLQLFESANPRVMVHLFNKQGLVIATKTEQRAEILKNRFPGNLKTLNEKIFTLESDHSTATHGGIHKGAVLATVAIQKGRFAYKGHGWYLLKETPLDEIFEPIHKMTIIIVKISLILIAIFAGFSLFIGWYLARPVVLLTRAVQKVAKGDLDFRVKITNKDEIGLLAQAFNRMVEDLDNITVSKDRLVFAREELKKSLQDLTQTQNQLVQSGKLASIGELAAGVAHELNQPLMVIRTTSQLSLRRLGKDIINQSLPDINKLDESFKSIEKNTKRMMNIINHLRTFSRQEEMGLSSLDVNKVFKGCFLMIGEQLKLRNIIIKENFSPALPKVSGDANKLEQVFLNLLSNARDAVVSRAKMENRKEKADFQGEIIITTRVSDKNKDKVQILIKDNGSGIPKDKKDKIFDPFFTTKNAGKGTGLGLSISHGIIKAHGGEIEVVQTGAGGTTFQIKLKIEY